MSKNTEVISRGRRFILLFVAWLLTAIATIPFTIYPKYFPIGLGRFFSEQSPDSPSSIWFMRVGWSIYIGLTIGALFLRRRLFFYIMYFVLCLLLALNCVGCRLIMSDVGNLH